MLGLERETRVELATPAALGRPLLGKHWVAEGLSENLVTVANGLRA